MNICLSTLLCIDLFGVSRFPESSVSFSSVFAGSVSGGIRLGFRRLAFLLAKLFGVGSPSLEPVLVVHATASSLV